MRFADRADAGEALADRLADAGFRSEPFRNPLILGIPRGGVVVAAAVARRLGADLDVAVARKVAAPGRPEMAIAAVAEGPGRSIDPRAVAAFGLRSEDLAPLVDIALDEVHRRADRYRDGAGLPDVRDRAVVLVDDGVATGLTVEAMIDGLRPRQPATLIVAAPVCGRDVSQRLALACDRVVFLHEPDDLVAVSVWYDDFTQVDDAEVIAALGGALALSPPSSRGARCPTTAPTSTRR